ncbi:MAG: IS1634 family transposase [Firmicutes bacterium]|nr:IS1634 family transposase [Bacillota bacterium]
MKNPKIHKQLVEAYWDPETKNCRHRPIVNITDWPDHVVNALELALKHKKLIDIEGVSFTTDDPYRGGGILAVYHLWKKYRMDEILSFISDATRQSIFLMVAQRILDPGSKLALKRSLEGTLFTQIFSQNRFDEDSLYEAMDQLYECFYEVQKALARTRKASPMLLLYDITSTYLEGTHADDADYGYSRDKRWDRYQVVVGLVCDGEGLPLAVEVWPGDTADKDTVIECEIKFRAKGETREVEEILRYWDKLRLSQHVLQAEGYESREWDWQLGELGLKIKKEMEQLELWKSVDRYRHSLQ